VAIQDSEISSSGVRETHARVAPEWTLPVSTTIGLLRLQARDLAMNVHRIALLLAGQLARSALAATFWRIPGGVTESNSTPIRASGHLLAHNPVGVESNIGYESGAC
jgi:hypothetical protein